MSTRIVTEASRRIFVTGGCGFIGSALVRYLIADTPHVVMNYDKLTYAATPEALADVEGHPRYGFVAGDIADPARVSAALGDFCPHVVVNLAAETHVDRSIEGPGTFVRTNMLGTQILLEATRAHWESLTGTRRETFRFHHVSTDEVYGALGWTGRFSEDSPYAPNSPYAASKAGGDMLVRAWNRTYGLPTLVTNCSNNYGPWQFPEKLIPLIVTKALTGEPIPVYGTGGNVRDWLYVDDHVLGLVRAFEAGRPGETYLLGGDGECTNLQIVRLICGLLDQFAPRRDGVGYGRQIMFVADRPGHDLRYAVDSAKARSELGWKPQRRLHDGLRATVAWYLDNRDWWNRVRSTRYGGQRLGVRVP